MRQQAILEICTHFNIGEYISHTKIERGGRHYLWHLNTSTGEYALKQLLSDSNNLELSETIATAFKEQGIPAISGIMGSDGRYMHNIDSINVLLHPWVNGEVIYAEDERSF